MQTKPGDHVTRGNDEKKRLVGRPSLERDEIRHRIAIDSSTESVNRLRRIREHLSRIEMRNRLRECGFDLVRRPEGHDERRDCHAVKILSASARTKSASVVILRARSLPGTTTIGNPRRSHS